MENVKVKYGLDNLENILNKLPIGVTESFADEINRGARIFVYGAGRSGLMLKAFAMRLMQAGKTVFVVGETVTPAICKGDILVVASASGRTESTCRYAKIAKSVGALVYCITADEASPIAEAADALICLCAPTKDAPDSKSVMGTLFEQALLLLLDEVVSELGADPAQMRKRHANLE